MKQAEFSTRILLDALKHQWKFMVILLLVFALIGVGAGALFAEKGVSEVAGEADALPAASFEGVATDLDYYDSCIATLRKCYNFAVRYHSDFVAFGNLTVQQEQRITPIYLELKAFSTNVLDVLDAQLSDTNAVPQADTQMLQKLNDAAAQLNTIMANLSAEANAIAKENHIIYSILSDPNSGTRCDLRHTHTLSTVAESFALFVMFCSMVGVFVSVFFGVYKECKRQKNAQAT